ncbi:hypothetical protein [Sorangium sp. So ce124]|uniref:hypothetical protein n=1 Tax=Sorangium sp. So ce124 TaxID=3133280 RepID=UPI003F5FE6DE
MERVHHGSFAGTLSFGGTSLISLRTSDGFVIRYGNAGQAPAAAAPRPAPAQSRQGKSAVRRNEAGAFDLARRRGSRQTACSSPNPERALQPLPRSDAGR